MVVTVYSKPACVQCNATYKTMDKKGIEYAKVDLSKQPEKMEEIADFGYMSAPIVTVEVDGVIQNHWSGFDPEKIEQTALELREVA